MPRDQESLIDIANAIKCILRYTDGVSKSDLETNDEKLSAILYQITIIDEATKRMSEKGSLQRSNQGFSDDDSTAASRFPPLFSTSQTSSKQLSQPLRQQYSEIPWRGMAGMRDVIIHEYDQLDLDVVWDVVDNKLPELLSLIDPLL